MWIPFYLGIYLEELHVGYSPSFMTCAHSTDVLVQGRGVVEVFYPGLYHPAEVTGLQFLVSVRWESRLDFGIVVEKPACGKPALLSCPSLESFMQYINLQNEKGFDQVLTARLQVVGILIAKSIIYILIGLHYIFCMFRCNIRTCNKYDRKGQRL